MAQRETRQLHYGRADYLPIGGNLARMGCSVAQNRLRVPILHSSRKPFSMRELP
jgi:hypothetical protein